MSALGGVAAFSTVHHFHNLDYYGSRYKHRLTTHSDASEGIYIKSGLKDLRLSYYKFMNTILTGFYKSPRLEDTFQKRGQLSVMENEWKIGKAGRSYFCCFCLISLLLVCLQQHQWISNKPISECGSIKQT